MKVEASWDFDCWILTLDNALIKTLETKYLKKLLKRKALNKSKVYTFEIEAKNIEVANG